MFTVKDQEYNDKYTVLLKGRGGVMHRIPSMLARDGREVFGLLAPTFDMLMMDDAAEFFDRFIYKGKQRNVLFEPQEQYEALAKLISMYVLRGKVNAIASFDLRMAKLAVAYYLGMLNKKLIESEGETSMGKSIYCGTQITGRNGVSYTAYSYKLTDYFKAMELLQKVDLISTAGNCDTEETDESYNAMLEIIYLALNEVVPMEDIESIVDAEFARKVMRVYYDLPQLF